MLSALSDTVNIFDRARRRIYGRAQALAAESENAPLFNPFESSTEWTAQIGGADRIEIEDEETTEDNKLDKPVTEKTDDK